MRRLLILSTFLLLLPISSWGDVSQKSMWQDLERLNTVLAKHYAPLEWKKSQGWDLEQEILKAKEAIQLKSSIKDYQRILKAFFHSMHDYHATVSFYSTESARLPFSFRSAGGHFYLTKVERGEWPPNAGQIRAGDRLVTFNGQPMDEVMLEFQNLEFQTKVTLTDRTFSELFFPLRLGALGQTVPQGEVEVGIQHQGESHISMYTLKWDHQLEMIKDISPTAKSLFSKKTATMPSIFQKTMLSPWHKALNIALEENQSFVPVLGKKIWEADNFFFNAYIFETAEKKRVGYIRIPAFNGSDAEIDEFRELVKIMQKRTKALVVDQVNNPGGILFYMYALASLLTDKPLKVPLHRISITQKEVAEAVELIPLLEMISSEEELQALLGETLQGRRTTFKMAGELLSYFYSIIDAWNQGLTFTEPLPLWGVSELEPHPQVHYTKPILILINELDISCGDFFPAIMQDNGRATLFGTPTAGAGGFVLQTSYPNLLGIESFSYTGSIAMRSDGSMIENLGVTPDIEYQLQDEDLTHNYAGYKRAVLDALKKL